MIARGHRPARGFTLIELMVVLMVIGVLVSMVTLSVGNVDRSLRTDAERLALLLALAREEAQVRGAPIRFETDGFQYRFVIYKGNEWRLLDRDAELRPRRWDEETRIVVQRPDGLSQIEFGRDMIDPPYRIDVMRGGVSARIDANGLGSFELAEPR